MRVEFVVVRVGCVLNDILHVVGIGWRYGEWAECDREGLLLHP